MHAGGGDQRGAGGCHCRCLVTVRWLCCRPRRRPLREQVAAWESNRTAKQKGVDWQFTATDARIKLKRLSIPNDSKL